MWVVLELLDYHHRSWSRNPLSTEPYITTGSQRSFILARISPRSGRCPRPQKSALIRNLRNPQYPTSETWIASAATPHRIGVALITLSYHSDIKGVEGGSLDLFLVRTSVSSYSTLLQPSLVILSFTDYFMYVQLPMEGLIREYGRGNQDKSNSSKRSDLTRL
jgi:hypothetical protein